MLINNKELEEFNCRCIKFIPSHSNYSNLNKEYFNSLAPIKGYNVEEARILKTTFVFKGDSNQAARNRSKFIEEIKSCTIKNGDFIYLVNISTSQQFDRITQFSHKQDIDFELLDVYESEKSITTNTNKTITINSPKPCYANLEISANTNVISAIISINDIDITINNIKGNETIYIGSGKVLAGGKSKIDDIDMWEFPILRPGLNEISVNREDVNVTVKYNERW